MLSERYAAIGGGAALRDSWRPYPGWRDRDAWEGLPAEIRRSYVEQGEDALSSPWPVLTASRYLDFFRDGNRSRYEELYFRRRGMLCALAVAECIEGKGRFLEAAADGLWLICEESTWCVPAHIGQVEAPDLTDCRRHVVDLFAAQTAAQTSWAAYILGERLDAVSPRLRQRLEREIRQRVLAPCVERDDFRWLGLGGQRLNNWTPWICSSWLAAELLTDPDPALRDSTVRRILGALDRFLAAYPGDGGCDEGPQYWNRAGACLLDCLEILHSATGGRLDVYDEPLVREIGRFILRAWICGDWFVNFADAPAVVRPAAWNVFRYGQRIGDSGLMGFGTWLARRQEVARRSMEAAQRNAPDMARLLPTLFHLKELTGEGATPAHPSTAAVPAAQRDVWLPAVQVMSARDAAADCRGFYVAAKGGHNAESHNHNDVGSFLVSIDGNPLIVDAGVETYTRRTFSAERYQIWTMQSGWHTLLPTFDAAMQQAGPEYAAREVRHRADDHTAELSLDIAAAYPADRRPLSWHRTIRLHRGEDVTVVDAYELAAPVAEVTLGILTPSRARIEGPGLIVFAASSLPEGRCSAAGALTWEGTTFEVSVQDVPIADRRLAAVWGDVLRRVLFRAKLPDLRGTWTWRVARP